MFQGRWLCAILLSFFFSCGAQTGSEAADEASSPRSVREPVLAGTWYPGDPDELRRLIRSFLSGVKQDGRAGEPIGLVVPHAGYQYSGRTAAHAYRLLEGGRTRRVIVIGPSHHVDFKGVSVDLQGGYRTPLGTVPVDQEFAKRLLSACSDVSRVPHAHTREHSLEIQIPFLQVVLKDFLLVPILMGRQDLETCSRLAEILIREMKGDAGTLVVASTDLSHFHHESRARELDGEFIRRLEACDARGLAEALARADCEACGGGPTVAALLAAKALGADRAVLLHYATSGDATGDRRRVVGYGAAAFFRGK